MFEELQVTLEFSQFSIICLDELTLLKYIRGSSLSSTKSDLNQF